ncbi:hypothetical protein K0M31_006385 [Melipona bicolor]|uniref:Uncharacterized protein n=1 Tax=Melipona bicolor TaxID=60889 RepID=A0AA40FTX7_9HYME|nr:hypothetical protein K0M31_006385 [Melipona bicolor]
MLLMQTATFIPTSKLRQTTGQTARYGKSRCPSTLRRATKFLRPTRNQVEREREREKDSSILFEEDERNTEGDGSRMEKQRRGWKKREKAKAAETYRGHSLADGFSSAADKRQGRVGAWTIKKRNKASSRAFHAKTEKY